jgi:hypothetical protein
MMIIIQ